MKLIIDIPYSTLKEVLMCKDVSNTNLYKAVENGIPLEQIRAEIERATVEMDYDTAKVALDIIDKYMEGDEE